WTCCVSSISSPTWSGLEDEHVSYNAGYTNVHELIPWRTLSGRQQLYQDHQWMRDFGESLLVYRPPIDTRSVKAVMGRKSNGNPEKALNFLTPHRALKITTGSKSSTATAH
ncbi:Respiratory nitrate reductase alpha chain, partial [Salmonella enterica subsp. enterica serovar Mississippi str. A4-633]